MKTSLNWTIPEFVKRSVASPAGTRLALATGVCPRSAKNSMNRRRISAAGSATIRGSGVWTGGGIGRNGTERTVLGGCNTACPGAVAFEGAERGWWTRWIPTMGGTTWPLPRSASSAGTWTSGSPGRRARTPRRIRCSPSSAVRTARGPSSTSSRSSRKPSRQRADIGRPSAEYPSAMATIAALLVALVAAIHVYIVILEMFLWRTPRALRSFGTTQAFADESRTLAANQGLYNGFLVAGLIWGLVAADPVGFQVKIFFLACVIVAGLYGAATVNGRILIIQAVPAALAMVAVLAAG